MIIVIIHNTGTQYTRNSAKLYLYVSNPSVFIVFPARYRNLKS